MAEEIMCYKGYQGSIRYSMLDGCFYGEVIGLNSLLLYEGESKESLRQDFEKTVDEYIEICKERGIAPEQP